MFAKLSGLMNQNNLLHCFDPSKNFMSSTLQKKKKKLCQSCQVKALFSTKTTQSVREHFIIEGSELSEVTVTVNVVSLSHSDLYSTLLDY